MSFQITADLNLKLSLFLFGLVTVIFILRSIHLSIMRIADNNKHCSVHVVMICNAGSITNILNYAL